MYVCRKITIFCVYKIQLQGPQLGNEPVIVGSLATTVVGTGEYSIDRTSLFVIVIIVAQPC